MQTSSRITTSLGKTRSVAAVAGACHPAPLPLPSSAGGRREYKRFGLDRPIAACNFTRLLLSPTPPARRRRPQGQSNGRTNCMHSHPSFFLLIIAMQGGVRRASPGPEGHGFLESSAQRPLRKFTYTKVRATSTASIGNECACLYLK